MSIQSCIRLGKETTRIANQAFVPCHCCKDDQTLPLPRERKTHSNASWLTSSSLVTSNSTSSE